MRTMRLYLACELLWLPYEGDRSGPIGARALIAWCSQLTERRHRRNQSMRLIITRANSKTMIEGLTTTFLGCWSAGAC